MYNVTFNCRYMYIMFTMSVTLCCWQKVTMMGRQTPGAGFLSSVRACSMNMTDLFSSLRSFSGYAAIIIA